MKQHLIGFQEALQLTLGAVPNLPEDILPLADCLDKAAANDIFGKVDSPSVDASLKDGFAVRSIDIRHATPENPVRMDVVGTAAAGGNSTFTVEETKVVRILTGARIPRGADAVVAEEFTTREGDVVIVSKHAEIGRNIFSKGSDVASGERICLKGDRLTPGMVGLLAAAGYHKIPVSSCPKVSMIATGDEVVIPGKSLSEGKLYASNLSTLDAWCRRYGMQTKMGVVQDNEEILQDHLEKSIVECDALITSGGAWTGDRDLVVRVLETLGWKQYFHRIRIGPGKAVGFGLLKGKPVFVLPGGPPSNLLAFLNIALPGLLKMSGFHSPSLPTTMAEIRTDVRGRDKDWTQFVFGQLETDDGRLVFNPLKLKSRLQSMANAHGLIEIPEGTDLLRAGTRVMVKLLS